MTPRPPQAAAPPRVEQAAVTGTSTRPAGPSIVPTPRTRAIAARMTRDASDGDYDTALERLGELHPGQRVALVVALLGLAAGQGNHARPGRPTDPPAEHRQLADYIACGTCGAKVYEPCRTRKGDTRADHPDRLMPRRCRCGEPMPKRKGQRWCQGCAEKRRSERQREYDQRRRRAA